MGFLTKIAFPKQKRVEEKIHLYIDPKNKKITL